MEAKHRKIKSQGAFREAKNVGEVQRQGANTPNVAGPGSTGWLEKIRPTDGKVTCKVGGVIHRNRVGRGENSGGKVGERGTDLSFKKETAHRNKQQKGTPQPGTGGGGILSG